MVSGDSAAECTIVRPIVTTRRGFLKRSGALALGAVVLPHRLLADEPTSARPRVVVARDEALTHGKLTEHAELLRKLLHAAMQKLTGATDAAGAWRQLFSPKDRVGIKVNTAGLATQPAVADALVVGLRLAGVPAENIVIWDRLDVELGKAGYTLNKSKATRHIVENLRREGAITVIQLTKPWRSGCRYNISLST